jgi:hypothetical protein
MLNSLIVVLQSKTVAPAICVTLHDETVVLLKPFMEGSQGDDGMPYAEFVMAGLQKKSLPEVSIKEAGQLGCSSSLEEAERTTLFRRAKKACTWRSYDCF